METKLAEYSLLITIISTLFAVFALVLTYIGYIKFKEADRRAEKIIAKKIEGIKIELENTINDILNAQSKLTAAYSAFERKDMGGAIALLKQAEEIYPRLYNLHNTLGYAYKEQGQYYPAIDEFLKAIELRPADVAGYNDVARLYAIHKRFDMAFKYLKKAIELDAESVCVKSDEAFKEFLQDKRYAKKVEKLLAAC